MNDSIRELLLKIDNLAKRGVGGEATSAKKRLDFLLEKHGIAYEDIYEDAKKEYFFKAAGWNIKILAQIIKSHNREIDIYNIPKPYSEAAGGNIAIECSLTDFLYIESAYSVFKKLWKSELDVFFYAFSKANNLLVQPDYGDSTELTLDELMTIRRAYAMSNSIKSETIRKQIEAKL